MRNDIPTGQREGQRLEFKARESLDDPRAIAREVVGFLNADGGSVWIGVPEIDGVGGAPTPIPNVAAARANLQDRLLDMVQPRFTDEEVRIDVVPLEAGGAVLKVEVQRPARGRGPFAFAHKGMLGFTRRADHRLVPLLYHEVRDAFLSSRSAGGDRPPALDWLIEQRDAAVGKPGGRRTFIGLVVEGADPLQDIPLGEPQRAWWEQTIRTNGRAFATSVRWSILGSGLRLRQMSDHLEAVYEAGSSADAIRVRAYSCGSIVAEIGTDSLTWVDDRPKRPEERLQFHPYFVLGLFASFCELASGWVRQLGPRGGHALIELGIGGTTGASLRAYSPDSYEWFAKDEESIHSAKDDPLVLSRPVRVSVAELVEHPLRAAVRVAERFYEAFDFELTDLPREVDRQLGTIALPD